MICRPLGYGPVKIIANKCKVTHQIATNKLDEIEQFIVEETASKNTKVVKDHLERVETLDGTFSNLGFWKLKQKLCPIAEDKYNNFS